LNDNKKKRIVVFQNPAYGLFNYVDYDIFSKILSRRFRCANKKFSKYLDLNKDKNWEYLELKDFSHEEVSEIMKESALFINLNCLEGFNVTVTEAMAAGTVVLCYEAYSGKDYLKDKENAYVFPNNYVYPLINKLIELVRSYDEMQNEFANMRKNAYNTALKFTEQETEKALLSFYHKVLI